MFTMLPMLIMPSLPIILRTLPRSPFLVEPMQIIELFLSLLFVGFDLLFCRFVEQLDAFQDLFYCLVDLGGGQGRQQVYFLEHFCCVDVVGEPGGTFRWLFLFLLLVFYYFLRRLFVVS